MENKDAVIRQWQASWVLLHRKLAGEQLCLAHSGLIVHPDYRNLGLAKNQSQSFDYSLKKYPNAKVFGINRFSCYENQL
jgi:hypothetical protein